MLKFEDFKRELLADPAVRAEYERLRPQFEREDRRIAARIAARKRKRKRTMTKSTVIEGIPTLLVECPKETKRPRLISECGDGQCDYFVHWIWGNGRGHPATGVRCKYPIPGEDQ